VRGDLTQSTLRKRAEFAEKRLREFGVNSRGHTGDTRNENPRLDIGRGFEVEGVGATG
jgi:hypothetical protein